MVNRCRKSDSEYLILYIFRRIKLSDIRRYTQYDAVQIDLDVIVLFSYQMMWLLLGIET